MKKIIPFFLLVLFLAACQKDPDTSKLSDEFVVYTDHGKDVNFELFSTFYIADSVMVIGNEEGPEGRQGGRRGQRGSTSRHHPLPC